MPSVSFDTSGFDPNSLNVQALLVVIDRLQKILNQELDAQGIVTKPPNAMQFTLFPGVKIVISFDPGEQGRLTGLIQSAQARANALINAGQVGQ